jgi:hypothetical protein
MLLYGNSLNLASLNFMTRIPFLLLLFAIPSTRPLFGQEKPVLETEKYLNFLAAIENSSTFNYFTVIKVKNLNTGVIKEICTKGNFVSGALHAELKAGYDKKGEDKVAEFVKTRKDRYFEFKNKTALNNISFYEYDTKRLNKIQSKYDFDKVVRMIKKDKKFAMGLSDEEMKYFAHLIFNKGYMTGESDCFGGTLEYVDRTKAN